MRRALFVLASAMLIVAAGSVVAGAESPASPDTSVTRHAVGAAGTVLAPGDRRTRSRSIPDTQVLGVKWSGDPNAAFSSRPATRTARGAARSTWPAPTAAPTPTPRTPAVPRRRFVARTSPIRSRSRTPTASGCGSSEGTVRDVQVVAVSSPDGLAGSASSSGGLGGGSVPTALAVSGVAIGALALPRKRGLSILLIVVVAGGGALVALDVAQPSRADAVRGPAAHRDARRVGSRRVARLRACPDGPDYSIPRIAVVHHTDGGNGYSQGASPGIVRGLYAVLDQHPRLLRPALQLPHRPVRHDLRRSVRRDRERARSERTRRTSTAGRSASCSWAPTRA